MARIHLPAFCRPTAFREFEAALPTIGHPMGLFRAAWAVSRHDLPDAELAVGEAAVESLASAVMQRVRSRQPQALLAHLHDVLFEVAGFRGNTKDYYAAANSYLPTVLATRQGLPITLVLIYRTVAAQTGLCVHGVNAPGHFLAEVETGEGDGASSMFVDPFEGGRVLNLEEALDRIAVATNHEISPEPSMLVRATPRQWLARILHNLQAVYAAGGRQQDVFAMQELEQRLKD
jgi:regulator of sirC expression with transglutaminase-like and TPR domain